MAQKKERNVVVLGLGVFGTTVATELYRLGNRVLGMDQNERTVSRLAETLTEAVIADCSDEDALREAGVGSYDTAVVAIGENMEANILCVMHLKLLGVKTIWAKALNKTHHRILSKLGVDRIILPEQETGQHVAQTLNNPLLQDYFSMGNSFYVVRIGVPERLIGKRLGELQLKSRYELRCIGMMRGCDYVECANEDVELQLDDQLLVLGQRSNLRTFGDSV